MKSFNGKWQLAGLVELGSEYDDMNLIQTGETKVQTGTHVLQFVYLGNTGFRFPIVHYPTREVDPSTLYIKFWETVGWLEMAGFSVIYGCCDGGQANRSFIQMHFKGKDAVKEKYTTTNIHTGQPLVFFSRFFSKFNKMF